MELPFTELDKPRWSRLNRPSELMCCRVAQGSKKDRLKKKVNAKAADNNASPRLNLAPTQDALVARMVSEEIRLDTLRWGLIPPWTKDRAIAHKLANARAETIDEKPSFKQPFKKRRCLLPVTGYYEWETRSDGKQPVYYSMRDGDLFCLAGLWESFTELVETESPRLPGLDLGQAEPAKLHTFTLITTTPNLLAKRVHDRMPVIVHPDDYAKWLAPNTPAPELKSLLRPFADEPMQEHYVTRRMSNPRYEAPDCNTTVDLS